MLSRFSFVWSRFVARIHAASLATARLRSWPCWETILVARMRLACGFAIVCCLSFQAGRLVCQEPAGSAKPMEQTPSTPPAKENSPAAQVPMDTAPAAPASPQMPAEAAKPEEPAAKTGEGTEEKTGADANPKTEPKTDAGTGASTTTKAAVTKKAQVNSAKGTTKRHKRAAPTDSSTPQKVVVREGGATEPKSQIAPGVTPAEAVRQRQNAERWLVSTDGQLKQLAGRTLNPQQQETVGQIHHYVQSARSALKEGDVGRASTLAQKAQLLSDDLVKH